jgi:hypothetical protein
MKARWQVLVLVAAVLICAALAQTQQGHVLLRNVGLSETPATYTELAFSEPGNLPRALTKPAENIKVSFSIHNVSGDPRSYQWSIILVHAGKSQVKANGSLLSPAQGQTEVTRSVQAACVGGRLQVVVRLISPSESINFWMTCLPAAATKQGKS